MKRLLWPLAAMIMAPPALAEDYPGPIALQLEPVAVQIKPVGKRPTKSNVTILLEVRDVAQVDGVCERIRSFHEIAAVTSVEMNKKKVDYTSQDLEKKIKSSIFYKYSSEKFLNVYVVAGHRRMGEGARVTTVPGSTPRCRSLDRIPLDILAYVRPKDDNAVAFEPSRMVDGGYPLATSTVGRPIPLGPDEGGYWLALAVGSAVAISIGGAGTLAGTYISRRRSRGDAADTDRRVDEK